MVRSILAFLAAIVSTTILAACSIYDYRYEYPPGPVDVIVAWPGAEESEPVHTLVSMRGVRKADPETMLPASVEVVLRVENTSPHPVELEPGSIALFSADLARFPDPIVRPGHDAEVDPGGSSVVQAYFPFPEGKVPGDFDLDGLNVRWTVLVEGHAVTSSASFARYPNAYYERYPNRVGVGFQRYDY